jgi:adenylate cyclase
MTDVERKLAAILSADVVGYSRLMAEDEAATIRTLHAYREEIAMLVRQHRGRVVDSPGDNVLAEFPTALDAVRCAVEIQGVLRARNASLPAERRMDFRIGVHMGDVAVEEGRVYGDGVNIAARLEALAETGGICISATVREQVRNKLDVGYVDLGDQTIKNIPEQVHVYRVQPRSEPEGLARGSVSRGKRHPRLRGALVAAAAVLLLLGVGLWASWPRPLGLLIDLAGVSGPPVDPPLPDQPSIAVLPFANMSGDPEQEYFSDGITEDLTTELARRPGLFVISRNSAFTYKGKSVKVEDMGRELGVRYVLEGSVRKAEGRVRITAQLIDATTGGHLWSERYDRDLSEIFALQSEIAEEILGAVDVEIGAAEGQRLARKPSESFTAVEAAWKGGYHLSRQTREDNEKARRLLARAVELDPGYAGAHALLALTYLDELTLGWSSDAKLLDRAEELGRRAVALDDSVPWGHLTMAWVHLTRGNSAEAIAAAERVIELWPNTESAHAARGLALAQEGRLLEATESVRRALRLNPRAPTSLLMPVAQVNIFAGRWEKAVEQLERVRTANPDHIPSRVILAAYYEREGLHDKASVAVAEILRVNPDFTVARVSGTAAAWENALGPQEIAAYMEALRKAGLPE